MAEYFQRGPRMGGIAVALKQVEPTPSFNFGGDYSTRPEIGLAAYQLITAVQFVQIPPRLYERIRFTRTDDEKVPIMEVGFADPLVPISALPVHDFGQLQHLRGEVLAFSSYYSALGELAQSLLHKAPLVDHPFVLVRESVRKSVVDFQAGLNILNRLTERNLIVLALDGMRDIATQAILRERHEEDLAEAFPARLSQTEFMLRGGSASEYEHYRTNYANWFDITASRSVSKAPPSLDEALIRPSLHITGSALDYVILDVDEFSRRLEQQGLVTQDALLGRSADVTKILDNVIEWAYGARYDEMKDASKPRARLGYYSEEDGRDSTIARYQFFANLSFALSLLLEGGAYPDEFFHLNGANRRAVITRKALFQESALTRIPVILEAIQSPRVVAHLPPAAREHYNAGCAVHGCAEEMYRRIISPLKDAAIAAFPKVSGSREEAATYFRDVSNVYS